MPIPDTYREGNEKKRRWVLYGALSEPEPRARKLARTVLRELSDGDIIQLPDRLI
jgi:hypothetical protein